jgi:hypothetical protein
MRYPLLSPEVEREYVMLRKKFHALEAMTTEVQRAYQAAFDVAQTLKNSEPNFFSDMFLMIKKNRLLKKYYKLNRKYQSRHEIFKKMQKLTDPKYEDESTRKGPVFMPVMQIRQRGGI